MKRLRTLASAVLLMAGAALLVSGSLAWMTLRQASDPALADRLADAALEDRTLTAALSQRAQAAAVDALAEQGIDAEALGIVPLITEIVDDALASAEVRAQLRATVERLQSQLLHELRSAHRERGPFVATVDVSSAVDDRLAAVTWLAPTVSGLRIEPVTVTVLDADAMENARRAHHAATAVVRIAPVAGLACVLGALAVTTRRHLIAPKAIAATGALSLVVAALCTWWRPGERIGQDASAGSHAVAEVIASAAHRCAVVYGLGGAALVVTAAAWLLLAAERHRGRHQA